ncbi:MAG: N-acetylmuramoyl-L-alanine amidase [Clostridia bacterium]|nr:N-acetylmuramoyl-L-alanine amidase [Clostridia bacterium]
MDKNQNFYFNQFKTMFAELDNDKKKVLHDYLEKMSPDDRMKHAVALGKKYYESHKVNESDKRVIVKTDAKAKENLKAKIDAGAASKGKTNNKAEPRREMKGSSKANSGNAIKPENVTKTNTDNSLLVPMLVAACIFLLVLCLLKFKDIRNAKKLQTESTALSSVLPTETTSVTTELPTPTPTPEPTATPEPTPTPAPTPIPLAADAPDLSGKTIVIDPGHQEITDETEEACADWLSVTKPRCTSGTVGKATGIHEYEYTLQFSLLLKSYLEECGAEVYITRNANDVNMSNQERAEYAVSLNPDLFLRIHADGANDSLESGVRVYVPDSGNYTGTNVSEGNNLGKAVAEALGLNFDKALATYVYTGLNYANTVPSFQISLGFLTNSDDESALLDENNQLNAAEAIAEFANSL